MPLINDLKTHGDEVRARLQPGEVLLALTSAAVAYGVTSGAEPEFWQTPAGRWLGISAPQQPSSQPSWVSRLNRGLGRAEAFSLDLPSDFPESLGGRTCYGPAGSLARQLQDALNGLRGKGDYFVVTSHQILVLTIELGLVWAQPRSVVLGAERRTRMLARGRIGMVFADGSWIVLGTSPHIGSWHAKQIVAAITGRPA